MFLRAPSVCVHQVLLRSPGKEVSPTTSPDQQRLSLHTPRPLAGVLVIQNPLFTTAFLLPKVFIRCWDSDWGQQAVTKMAL